MQVLVSALSKAALNIGLKLLSEEIIEELIIWGVRKLAESSKTKVGKEIADIVEEHLS